MQGEEGRMLKFAKSKKTQVLEMEKTRDVPGFVMYWLVT